MSESGLACQRCVRALGGGTYGDSQAIQTSACAQFVESGPGVAVVLVVWHRNVGRQSEGQISFSP